jgi:hypothetical protein
MKLSTIPSLLPYVATDVRNLTSEAKLEARVAGGRMKHPKPMQMSDLKYHLAANTHVTDV